MLERWYLLCYFIRFNQMSVLSRLLRYNMQLLQLLLE